MPNSHRNRDALLKRLNSAAENARQLREAVGRENALKAAHLAAALGGSAAPGAGAESLGTVGNRGGSGKPVS